MEGPELLSEADREFLRNIARQTRLANERERAGIALRLAAARAEARLLTAKLSANPEVRRVILFGSASTGRRFRLDSDIDLAVEGGDILAHRACVEKAVFPVDVVDISALPSFYRESIESEGELLYESRD